ncbi:MAG: hypothetical protein WBZ48_07360 [Bacteroidota bacterium]
MHTGGGNYHFASQLGGTAFRVFEESTYEKSLTDKAQTLGALRKRFVEVNGPVKNTPESSYGKTTKFFGTDETTLDLIFVSVTHQAYVLGEQIAYARMNKFVPPRTVELQKKMKEQEIKK